MEPDNLMRISNGIRAFCIWGMADGFHCLIVEADLHPCLMCCFGKMLEVIVGSIGPVVTFEKVPEILDGIEFWRIGWQLDKRHVFWHLQPLAGLLLADFGDLLRELFLKAA
jgi:hypothetical protein